MNALLKLSRLIDTITESIGQAARWLVLIVVLISAGNAVMRYTINYSSNAFLEIQWYLFGLIFLRCCYYGLVYFPQLDDYIQLHNYPVYHGAKLVILEQGLLASRPLAAVGDYFFWSGFSTAI